MKLKQYPKYKESGVQWIGRIPKDWETNKVKHNILSLEKSGLEASEGEEFGKYPFFTSSQTQDRFVDKPLFDKECLVMGTGGFASLHYINGKFAVSMDCLVLKKQKEFDMKFLYYELLSNISIIDDLGFWGMGLKHLQKDFFYNMPSYFPSLKEQSLIASFLDKKTSEINTLIEKDNKLIELLTEKRIALINHVVTKGLSPKAKFKDSGIDWIGKIPEGRKIKRAKFVFFLSRGFDLPIEDFVEGKYPVYGSNGIIGYHNKFTTKGPSMTIGRSGSVGEINFIEGEYWAHNTALYLQRNYENNVRFIYYLLSTMRLDALSSGSAVGTLNRNYVHDEYVSFPPKSEQITIAEYLDKATSKIDTTIQKIEKKIELLEEYKKSLIHHVVTGKVDVRGLT